MTERPILMQAEMVRATLSGDKTETRRIMNPQPSPDTEWVEWYQPPRRWQGKRKSDEIKGLTLLTCEFKDRFGKPGDRLWVKETFRIFAGDEYAYQKRIEDVRYRATAEPIDAVSGPWKPSIFMWRWASRLTLEIEEVRVERLQDITEASAAAEGVSRWVKTSLQHPLKSNRTLGQVKVLVDSYREAYRLLWDEINGRGSWDVNPFVWVIRFKKL